MITLGCGLSVLLLISLSFIIVPYCCITKGQSNNASQVNGTVLIVCLLVIILASLSYKYWGHWSQYHDRLIHLEAERLLQDPQHVIVVLQQRVAKVPNDEMAWFLLGQMYFNQENITKALQAFATAHRLAPNNARASIRYAQAMYINNNEHLDEQANNLLKAVLLQDPKNPEAITLLAMDKLNKGNVSQRKNGAIKTNNHY